MLQRDFQGGQHVLQSRRLQATFADGQADGKTKGFIEPKRLQGGGMGGGMGLRVGFININDMYNNDVGQGVVYAYEAYEAK